MKVALIYPPALLARMGDRTNYHLILPHLCHQKRYSSFYQTRSAAGDFVILDNGAAEGLYVGPKYLLTVADEMGVDEVVVPDELFGYNESVAHAMGFARHARPEYQYMAVVQGNNYSEFMTCLKAYSELPAIKSYVTTIGVPRLMTTATDDPYARVRFAEWMITEGYAYEFYVHFLGATSWLEEVRLLKETTSGFENFRGIDTSAPVYMGMQMRTLEDDYVPRPENYFDSYALGTSTTLVHKNIERYLDWAGYDEAPPLQG